MLWKLYTRPHLLLVFICPLTLILFHHPSIISSLFTPSIFVFGLALPHQDTRGLCNNMHSPWAGAFDLSPPHDTDAGEEIVQTTEERLNFHRF